MGPGPVFRVLFLYGPSAFVEKSGAACGRVGKTLSVTVLSLQAPLFNPVPPGSDLLEPEKKTLEEEIPFENYHFQVPC